MIDVKIHQAINLKSVNFTHFIYFIHPLKQNAVNSLVVRWLGSHASAAGGTGSIPGQGTRILQVEWWGKKKTKQDTHGCCAVLSHLVRVQIFGTPLTIAHQAPLPMGMLQARILELVAMPSSRTIFPTQGLLHCRQILYQLS